MHKILILFAHPYTERSRVHQRLISTVENIPGVTLHDLYENYPAFDIDVKREQKLVEESDLIVWQYPFYWYSCPPLLKQWLDLVLTHGWAYGQKGKALQGKKIFCAISSGGIREAYQMDGYNRYTIAELLRPMERTAILCNMQYLPVFVIHGTHRATELELDMAAEEYARLLQELQKADLESIAFDEFQNLNEWLRQRPSTIRLEQEQ